jgi:pimeloyl-ACP methyl ester carboxylesterase
MRAERAAIGSASEFVRVRGLRYHVRRWGRTELPRIFLLHGWLDVSATFEPLVAPLLDRWQVLAPDWRGFGYTEWPQDGYWFADYLADLDALLDHYSPDGPVLLVGHSMGGNAASLYAGLRPLRVSKLVCLDTAGLVDAVPQQAPLVLRDWLDRVRTPHTQKTYASFEELAQRVRRQHPQLSADHALFIAHCWAHEDGHGRIALAADPRHWLPFPVPYRAAEAIEMFRSIEAPTLFIDAGAAQRAIEPAELQRRRSAIRRQHVTVVAGAGHMLHFDAPEATAALIAEFLAQGEYPCA